MEVSDSGDNKRSHRNHWPYDISNCIANAIKLHASNHYFYRTMCLERITVSFHDSLFWPAESWQKSPEIRFHLLVLNGNKFPAVHQSADLFVWQNHLNVSSVVDFFPHLSKHFLERRFHLFDLIWRWLVLVMKTNNDTDDDDDDIIVCVSIFGHKNRFYSLALSTGEGSNTLKLHEEVHKISKITIKYPQWIQCWFFSLFRAFHSIGLFKNQILFTVHTTQWHGISRRVCGVASPYIERVRNELYATNRSD